MVGRITVVGFTRRVLQGSSPAHAVLLTMVTQGLVVLLNVATGVITARLLGPDGRGIFTATTIWPQFLAGVGALGLPTAIVYYMRNAPESRGQIAAAAYLLTGLISVLATVAGLIFAPFTMPDASHGTILLAQFCILWTFTNMLTVVLRQIMVASGAFKAFSTSNYLTPLIYLIGLLLAWALVGMSPEAAIVCLMAASLLGSIWAFRVVQAIVRPQIGGSTQWLNQMSRYSAKFAASDLSGTVLNTIDRLVLIPFLTPADLGIYVVAYSLSRLMFVLQTAIGSVLYPAMAGRSPPEIKDLHDLAFRLILYTALAVIVFVSAIAYPAIVGIYGVSYAGAVPLLRILLIEAGITCVGQVVIQLYLSLNQPGFPSMVQTLSLAVATICLLVLVPRYGGAGAAISLVIAAVVRVAALLAGIRLRLGMPGPRLLPSRSDLAYVQARLM